MDGETQVQRWGLVLLLGVVAVGYAGVWHAGFVWDDIPLVVENTALGVDADLLALFTEDLWTGSGAGSVASGYYRPLVLLSFLVDRALFGLQSPGYHLHSLLWHLVATALLYGLLGRLFGGRGALFGATWFALHPVQSEVVVWVSARNDIMCAAFGFAALWSVLSEDRLGWGRVCGAAALAAAAALSKESAYLLPILVGLLGLAQGWERERLLRRVGVLGAGVAAVVSLRFGVGVVSAALPSEFGLRVLSDKILGVLTVWGSSLVRPWPLSSARDLSWIEPGLGLEFALSCALVIGLLALFWASTPGQRRWVVFGGLWGALLLGLTLVPIADKGGFGDRFLYWPMAGFSFVLAAVAGRAQRWWLLAFTVPALLVIHARMPDWKHDRRLWGAAVRDVPTSTNHLSLGHAFSLYNRHKRAHVAFATALTTDGIDVEACPRVVGSAMRAGLPAQALRMGTWAIGRGCPSGPNFAGWMAIASVATGDWAEARRWAAHEELDPKGRILVARAVLARRSLDTDGYGRVAQQWDQADSLGGRVDALLLRTENPAAP